MITNETSPSYSRGDKKRFHECRLLGLQLLAGKCLRQEEGDDLNII